jgi:hypothetical protein
VLNYPTGATKNAIFSAALFDPLTSVYNSELLVSALGIPLAFADIDWVARCFAENITAWKIELSSRMDSRNRRHPFQRVG